MNTYSQEFKESLVKKVLSSPKQTMSEIARQAQVSVSTLHTWVHRLKPAIPADGMTVNSIAKSSSHWTTAQRFQALLDTAGLEGDALSQHCRKHGLYKHQLDQWRKEFMSQPSNTKPPREHMNELKKLREQNKELQRELRRKEKALAEASALLLLKKKADLIWPVNEDDV